MRRSSLREDGELGSDLGRCLLRQLQAKQIEQHAVICFGLGVAGQHRLAPVGGGRVHVHISRDLELGDDFTRRDAIRQSKACSAI